MRCAFLKFQIADSDSSRSFTSNNSPLSLNRTASPISISSNDEESANRFEVNELTYEGGDEWMPHCFVKTGKSKEFVGCTSISEAFHRLDLARSVKDIRRFNYICKVLQILVQEKLTNLSATARKTLLSILQAIVIQSVVNDFHVSTVRSLVSDFGSGLEGHLYGSPKLVTRQLIAIEDMLDFIAERCPRTLADSVEESITFMDLPREILYLILRKLPDHISLLESAKTHEVLGAIVEGEGRVWKSLCYFHFTDLQIENHYKNSNGSWRHTFFELKKFHGLKEFYADLIHLCCHCKALFWKDQGHPCISNDAPSVRVMPQQFVDMLLFM